MAEKAKPRVARGVKQTASKRKPKAEKQRAAAARPGHNSGTGEVPDAVYLRYLPKIEAAQVRVDKAKEIYDQAKGEYRSIFDAAKEDGCNIDAIKNARKLDEQDMSTVATNYADTGRVLRLMKSPLALQLELFADIDRPAPVNAFLAGQRHGLEGKPIEENPHTTGSEEWQQWESGWRDGQATNADKFRDAQRPASPPN